MMRFALKRSAFMTLMVLMAWSGLSFVPLEGHSQIPEVRIADARGDWGYPNPYRHYPRGPGYVRMSWVFDTLIWKDQNGLIPALADSWSYNPRETAFVFKLNPKAKWHDGRPLTAEDVVFTLAYFKQHPYRSVTLDHVGQGKAEDPHTVVIPLTKPYAPFLCNIGGTMPILPRHVWADVKEPKGYSDPRAFIGSGPYLFRDFNKAQGTYLYEAFKDYYQGRPKADRLIYIRSSQPLMSLLTDQADLVIIQPEMAETLEKKGMVIIRDQRGWNKKLMINHRKPPFNDRRFRQSLAHAIDQQEIIDKSQRGFASPASYGLLSVDHEMYNPNTPTYRFDRNKARSLIESLGYQKDNKGFYSKEGRPLKLELLASKIAVAGQNIADRDGEVIKKQLEAVGISVDLVTLEQATTDSQVKEWEFDLAISGHGGIYGDPRTLNEMISSRYGAASVNSARFDASPELNRLMEEQMVTMEPEKRKTLVYKIQEVYAEEVPAISLYYPVTTAAYNPKKGITWYYTRGGISTGIPIPQNKMSLIR
jgi:peptide/nickel transport system substrate-binding protein